MTDLDKKVAAATHSGRPKINVPIPASYTNGYNVEHNFKRIKLLRDEVTQEAFAILVVPADLQQPEGSVDPVMPIRITNGSSGASPVNTRTPADGNGGAVALVTEADNMLFDANAALWRRWRGGDIVNKNVQASALTNVIWTPAGGKKFRLMSLQLIFTQVITKAASGTFTVFDGATALFAIDVSTTYAASMSIPINLPPNGYLSAAANNTLNTTLDVALTAGKITCIAWGMEE